MTTTGAFLIAILINSTIPYVVWRLGRTEYYAFVFQPPGVQALNGIAWWAVMCFVWLAGIELDLTCQFRPCRALPRAACAPRAPSSR